MGQQNNSFLALSNVEEKIVKKPVTFDQVYQEKGTHPGTRYIFDCTVYEGQVKNIDSTYGRRERLLVRPAYNKQGMELDGMVAVFVPKETRTFKRTLRGIG